MYYAGNTTVGNSRSIHVIIMISPGRQHRPPLPHPVASWIIGASFSRYQLRYSPRVPGQAPRLRTAGLGCFVATHVHAWWTLPTQHYTYPINTFDSLPRSLSQGSSLPSSFPLSSLLYTTSPSLSLDELTAPAGSGPPWIPTISNGLTHPLLSLFFSIGHSSAVQHLTTETI